MNKTQYKTQLRKLIAQKQIALLHLTGKEKMDIISQVNEHRRALNNLVCFGSDRAPTVSDLISVLSENENNEKNAASAKPSDLGFKRWALKASVLEYYVGLGAGVDEKVLDGFSTKLSSKFAPNQEKIYNIWVSKLDDICKAGYVEEDSVEKSTNSGFGRGSSFEKQLERYREDFVNQLLQKVSEE